MLLPVLLAVGLRRRRVSPHRGEPGASATGVVSPVADAPGSPYLLRAALEGLLWGLAIWIKPHILVVALMVWLVEHRLDWGPGQRLLRATAGRHRRFGPWRRGGGGLGIGWMLASGTWSPVLGCFPALEPALLGGDEVQLPYRYSLTFFYLPPWSLLHLVAVPLALWNLRAARFWSAESDADSLCRSRALLAGLYLGWMAQTLYLQRAYEYVHVPETILALALLTAQRWHVGFACLTWFAGAALVWLLAFAWPWFGDRLASFHKESPRLADNLLPFHPLVWPGRLACWPHCLGGSSADLRDRLTLKGGTHPAASWSRAGGGGGLPPPARSDRRRAGLLARHDAPALPDAPDPARPSASCTWAPPWECASATTPFARNCSTPGASGSSSATWCGCCGRPRRRPGAALSGRSTCPPISRRSIATSFLLTSQLCFARRRDVTWST